MEPRELMRRKEKEFAELGLADESLGRKRLIAAMVEHPRLIERPVALAGDRVVLGRPPEKVLELI
jgi:arsenate reductase